MNSRIAIVFGMLAATASVFAMPTKAELDQVAGLVQDLMKPEEAALKAGTKTRAEVAAAAVALAEQAESEAAKLLLMKGALNLYVRAGAYDKAGETLAGMRAMVADLDPQYQANMLEAALKPVPKKDGAALRATLDEMKAFMRIRRNVKGIEDALAKSPSDKSLYQRLGEHRAQLGEWAKALEAFARCGDPKVAAAAGAERSGSGRLRDLADFWWDYPGRRRELEKAFRQHAVALYGRAIAGGEVTGLNRVQVQRRIDEAGALGPALVAKSLYCVVDVSGGPGAARYPVSYLDGEPAGGWTDEFKTTKIVLRKIPAGTFDMGDPTGKTTNAPVVRVTLSKPCYMGVFEVTQKQYELVMGANPSEKKDPLCPVGKVSYNALRGKMFGSRWPASRAVDKDSFMGRLQLRTGCAFDLPTEAQWEHACRAGTKTAFNNGGNDPESMQELGRFKGHDKRGAKTNYHVGSYRPNAWGLYDMHGGVWEWCLDWKGRYGGKSPDPCGPKEGWIRVVRGGSLSAPPADCASWSRGWNYMPEHDFADLGFRLCWTQK